jgi:hypothetical protein
MKEQVVSQPDASTDRSMSKEAGMNGKFRRRAAMVSVAALSAGGLMLGFAATASASAFEPVLGNAGIFIGTDPASGKVGIPDLAPGDVIVVDCWTRGRNIGNGNVWYKVTAEIYNHLGGVRQNVTGWAYGGSVDSNEAFHRGDFPAC